MLAFADVTAPLTAMKYQRNTNGTPGTARNQFHGAICSRRYTAKKRNSTRCHRGHTAAGGSSVAMGRSMLGANVVSGAFEVAGAVAVSTGRSLLALHAFR